MTLCSLGRALYQLSCWGRKPAGTLAVYLSFVPPSLSHCLPPLRFPSQSVPGVVVQEDCCPVGKDGDCNTESEERWLIVGSHSLLNSLMVSEEEPVSTEHTEA